MSVSYENPFTPSFGQAPNHLAGRKELISTIEQAFRAQYRRPELTSVFYGARGTGKTTLLSVSARIAAEAGWVVVRSAALSGLLSASICRI